MPLGPYGITVEIPQNVGSVTTFLPNNIPNRGAQSTTTAWVFWKHFTGTVLRQGYNDLNNLLEARGLPQ